MKRSPIARAKKASSPQELVIRLLMLSQGHTVSGLARSCGISQPYLSMILAGQRQNAVVSKALARKLRVAPHFFNGGNSHALSRRGTSEHLS